MYELRIIASFGPDDRRLLFILPHHERETRRVTTHGWTCTSLDGLKMRLEADAAIRIPLPPLPCR
jgi:hypothetical protein